MTSIGSLHLPSRVIYAPLAGYTDFPFRKLVRSFFPGLIYTEMTKIDALVRYDIETFEMLSFSSDMHPIGCQLCGSDPHMAREAARIAEGLGFDCIDLNCGCPVDKVTKDGSGSAMLKDLPRIGEVVSSMVAAVRIPVTVKIRAGWDDNNLVAKEVAHIVAKAGAQAIAVHGRTRKQGYSGKANWNWISEVVNEKIPNLKVFGNGDVFVPEDGVRMLHETGADGLLIARGALACPWLGRDIDAALRGAPAEPLSQEQQKDVLRRHFALECAYFPKKKVLLDMRRIATSYCRHEPQLRHAIVNASWEELVQIIG